MRFSSLSALALAAEVAYGYLDTAPFFMFSTSELLSSTNKLQTASSIATEISKTISQCPSDFYILVSQQGVTAKDFKSQKVTPALAQRLSSSSNTHPEIRSSISIPEVVGSVDGAAFQEVLEAKCNVQTTVIDVAAGAIPVSYGTSPRLISVSFPAPSSSKGHREEELAQNDAFFASVLDFLPSKNYTVLYTTTSDKSGKSSQKTAGDLHKQYEMDSSVQDALHMDLRRDLGAAQNGSSNNQTMIDGPLFDKYQFFTPGIFMGFSVGLLLLLILYVAVSGVASLQVSYAAFDKESGPLSAKKQQ